MFFAELEPETRVRLRITIEETLFEFETRVLKKHKKSMLILPIRKDGRILNVQGENVSVDIMLSREEDKPMIWQNTGMECVKHKGQIFYAVPCELEGKEYNRRGDFRLFIGEEHHCKVGHGSRDRIVLLKDLSNSGFAFVYPEDIPGSDGAFVYMMYPAKLEESVVELPLLGKVVRKMPLDDGRILYGCALVKKNEMIGHYINQKQMEQLAKKSERFSSVQKKGK